MVKVSVVNQYIVCFRFIVREIDFGSRSLEPRIVEDGEPFDLESKGSRTCQRRENTGLISNSSYLQLPHMCASPKNSIVDGSMMILLVRRGRRAAARCSLVGYKALAHPPVALNVRMSHPLTRARLSRPKVQVRSVGGQNNTHMSIRRPVRSNTPQRPRDWSHCCTNGLHVHCCTKGIHVQSLFARRLRLRSASMLQSSMSVRTSRPKTKGSNVNSRCPQPGLCIHVEV